ncbi:MAG: DUF2358 domain-containing protein [Cyanobacteria bacterium J083]|nr:MAG: DUF2358 domain-containing protein [Cyanobacteria bacterium J083]
MDIVEILKEDYQRFPFNQTYTIYAEDVYFQDPLNRFRGLEKYQKMIDFLTNFFSDITMELYKIERQGDTIYTEWSLKMISPLPWKPHLTIPGRSELQLNQQDLIISHIDYWHISIWDLLKQNLFPANKISHNNK